MFSFNLLPQLYQHHTMRWLLLRHIHHGLLWCTSAAAIIAIIMVGLGWYIQRSLNQENIRLQETLSQPVLNQISTSVHTVNQRIAALRSIQQQHHTVVPLIAEIFRLFPNNVTLTSVDIMFANERIAITGVARDRNALKMLQEAFEDNTTFVIDQFPFEEFAQANEIPFEIVLKMNANDFQLDDLSL